MTEALTDDERAVILARVGYTEDVDEPQEVEQVVEHVVPQDATKPKATKPKKKKEDAPTGPTITSPLRDNEWQQKEFDKRKATPEMGLSKEAQKEHNRMVWESLGKERTKWNKAVKALRRQAAETGSMQEHIAAKTEAKATPESTLADLLGGFTPEQIADALRERMKSDG